MSGEAKYTPKDPAARWDDPESNWKPPGYVPPKPTVVDEMLAGKKSAQGVADTIIDEAYGPLKQYCFLPPGFANRVLEYERHGIGSMSVE